MKYATLFVLTLLMVSCKDKPKKTTETELSIAQKIANAHGFQNWKKVSEIAFTFNVDRDSSHFERSWIWKPKTNEVTLITENDTIIFNRKHLDSLSLDADKSFINDKYWLLAPFQLVWDSGTTISTPIKEQAPISKTQLNKITLTYPNEGGYTPGDAYDFYYDEDYLIKEWVYRQGNSSKPSMITSWENYKPFNGLKIATIHKKNDADWALYFTNVKVDN